MDIDELLDLESEVTKENNHFVKITELYNGDIDNKKFSISLGGNGILVDIEGFDNTVVLSAEKICKVSFEKLLGVSEDDN